MHKTILTLLLCLFPTVARCQQTSPTQAISQSPQDFLSREEIQEAFAAPAKKHHAKLLDWGSVFGPDSPPTSPFSSGADTTSAQTPSIDVYMPDAWIALNRDIAKSQYKKYAPVSGDPDTLRAITVTAYGSAGGTTAGPICDSVIRVALIANKGDSEAVEAVKSEDVTLAWHNGFGATASCSVVTAKFMLSDVQRIEAAAKGEDFIIGVFYGDGKAKLYTVKKQYRKDLGL